MSINKGAFLVARIIEESDVWIYKPSWWLKVWIHLISNANHKDIGKYKKGSLLTSVPSIYDRCYLKNEGISKRALENVIKWLKSTEQITTQKTTRGMWITVCNYNKYQNLSNYRNGTENGTENDIGTEQERNDKQQLNNETINIYIDLFNELYSKRRGLTDKVKKHLKARLKNYTIEQICVALRNLHADPFFNGQNPNNWKPEPLFLIRNDDQVARFLDAEVQAPKPREHQAGDDPNLIYFDDGSVAFK